VAMDLHVRESLKDLAHRLDTHRGEHEDEARELKAHVEGALDADDHKGLGDRLSEGAVKFESAHPDIASTLRRVADMLGAGGL
jgi:hypothetical protein